MRLKLTHIDEHPSSRKHYIMNFRISLLVLSALLLSGPAGAQAYKCRTADGQIEISSTPCPNGANTVKTVREEPIPEARRQQAEQEAARMRNYVEKREAAQRAEETADRERQVVQRQSSTVEAPTGRSADDCLRALDQQALQPMQRAQMEAACRGNASGQPVYVPVPVPVPVYGNNPPPQHTHRPANEPVPSTLKPVPTKTISCQAGAKNCR